MSSLANHEEDTFDCKELQLHTIDKNLALSYIAEYHELGISSGKSMEITSAVKESYIMEYDSSVFLLVKKGIDRVAIAEGNRDFSDWIGNYGPDDYRMKIFISEGLLQNKNIIECVIKQASSFLCKLIKVNGIWIKGDDNKDQAIFRQCGFNFIGLRNVSNAVGLVNSFYYKACGE